MEHVQISIRVSGHATDLTQMEVIDRPVVDHFQLATERFFVVLVGVPVAQYVLIFLGEDLPPVVGKVIRLVAVLRWVDRMKMLRTLATQSHPSTVILHVQIFRQYNRA